MELQVCACLHVNELSAIRDIPVNMGVIPGITFHFPLRGLVFWV